jgi:hypothetical protein
VKKWTKTDPQSEARLRLIADLGCRRDKILQSPELDLQALAQLLTDYESADLIYATADLRRRLEWYRGQEKI